MLTKPTYKCVKFLFGQCLAQRKVTTCMHVGKSLPLDSYYMDDYVSAGNKWLAYWYCRDTDSTKEKKGPNEQ